MDVTGMELDWIWGDAGGVGPFWGGFADAK